MVVLGGEGKMGIFFFLMGTVSVWEDEKSSEGGWQ